MSGNHLSSLIYIGIMFTAASAFFIIRYILTPGMLENLGMAVLFLIAEIIGIGALFFGYHVFNEGGPGTYFGIFFGLCGLGLVIIGIAGPMSVFF